MYNNEYTVHVQWFALSTVWLQFNKYYDELLNSDIFALKSDTVCSNLLDLQMNRSKKIGVFIYI